MVGVSQRREAEAGLTAEEDELMQEELVKLMARRINSSRLSRRWPRLLRPTSYAAPSKNIWSKRKLTWNAADF
jgi:hypothetical protein